MSMLVEDENKFEQVGRQMDQIALEKEYREQTTAFIEEKITLANQMGANDSEIFELRRIEDLFSRGQISNSEARKRAEEILNRKNDYH